MSRPVPGRRWNVDRRSSRRFQISLAVRYRLVRHGSPICAGIGRTLDISGKGIAFTTEEQLPNGVPADLLVDWPALLNENCALRLSIHGRIVRTEAHAAALRIQAYEFRTCKPDAAGHVCASPADPGSSRAVH